jgi:putative ABC transport system permease protein
LHANWVGPRYFETLGIPFITRPEVEPSSDRQVVFVNEAFVRRYWPGSNPIGKRLAWEAVDGVVADTRAEALWQDAKPAIYLQHAQPPQMTSLHLLVKASGDSAAMAAQLRQIVRAADPSLDISKIRTMEEIFGRSLAPQRFTLTLFAVFAIAAVVLAAIGIYGVMSFVVTQRTREIGVRLALGAGKPDVLSLVIGQGMVLATAGAVLGLVTGLGATRAVRSLLFQIAPTDPVAFLCAPVLVLLVALFACYLPARRAVRIHPMVALRQD